VQDIRRLFLTDSTYISMIIAYPALETLKHSPRPDFVYDLRSRPNAKSQYLTQIKIIIDEKEH
jgi:hypothetical protein